MVIGPLARLMPLLSPTNRGLLVDAAGALNITWSRPRSIAFRGLGAQFAYLDETQRTRVFSAAFGDFSQSPDYWIDQLAELAPGLAYMLDAERQAIVDAVIGKSADDWLKSNALKALAPALYLFTG
jgi:hypothetical protein